MVGWGGGEENLTSVFNPPMTISLSDRPGYFFKIRFLTRPAGGHTTICQTVVWLLGFVKFVWSLVG